MFKKPNLGHVSSDMDPFSAIYAITRWTDVELFYRKDRAFYLVFTKKENGGVDHLFWIDVSVFKKLWELELINDENVDVDVDADITDSAGEVR